MERCRMNEDESQLLYGTLQQECNSNKLYFENHKDEKSQKLYVGFIGLEEQILNLLPLLDELRQIAPSYDFKNVPANGYRSFIKAADKFSNMCLKICKNIRVNRSSLFFQKAHYAKEIMHCVEVLVSLNACFQLLQLQRTFTEPQTLFLEEPEKIDAIEKLIKKLDVKSFYGRFIGFQYGESTQPVVKTVAIMMAAFSQYYFHEKNVIQCAAIGSQYFANPDLRAECLEQITSYRKTTVYFCKNFWNMSEHDIVKKMNVLLQPTRFINERFELPTEPLQLKSEDGRIVDVQAPSAYIGSTPLYVRLLSSVKRKGMEYFKRINENKGAMKATSDWFILHVHGGGFISQTSESHQIYLKDWSRWTDDTPILSVDYSLAPEAPYPRALEEILYAYVWALNNCERLGTTAKRIVFAGDSAGGNLCMSLTLKCIELNIRKPDGVFSAYGPTVLQFYPSPSRFLGFMDPLLSFGFMLCSIKAYVHVKNRSNSTSTLFESDFERRSLTPEEGSLDEDYAEKESILSPGSDALDATDNSSPSSFLEFSPADFEENSSSIVEPHTEEMSLPSKYKNIIKGFMSNLKEKFTFNDAKMTNFEIDRTPDLENITSISQLVVEAQDSVFLSPAKADDRYIAEFPAMSILTVEMDPCLDDCITWAKRLEQQNRVVQLDVLPNMAHGFLNVSLSSKEAYHGSMFCAQRIKELLKGETPKDFQKVK